jgi:uncharacterized surface protein with fasciclin (FAS1) repeats
MTHRFAVLVASAALALAASSPALAGPKGQGPKGPNLVDVATDVNAQTGLFDTLLAAVGAADPAVAATLAGGGQHTVFAPTDDAFAALGLDESNLCLLSQEELTKILLYHVARGQRDAGEVLASDTIRTLLGTRVDQNGGVLTDQLDRDSTIIVTDVFAANGVIHVINAVLLPFAPTIDPSGCQ